MRAFIVSLALTAFLAGCAGTSTYKGETGSVAIVPSPYEPAAQFNGSNANYADGAVIGAAGGAGIGAMSAQASAGAAVDAITTDPGGRIADARGAIEQALADMRLTDALAGKTAEQANLPLRKSSDLTLEVGVSDLQILAREKEMALVLRARSRLYRTASGEVIDERVSEAQTDFRKYQDWAADEVQPLRRAVDAALADLSRSIVSAQLQTPRRAGTSARRGG